MNEYSKVVEYEEPKVHEDEMSETIGRDETIDEMSKDKEELKLEAIRLRKEGYSIREIAKKLGIPQQTIGYWLRGMPKGEGAKGIPEAIGTDIKVSNIKIPPEVYTLYKYFRENGYEGDISQFLIDYAKWGIENKEGIIFGVIKKEGDAMPIPEFKLKSDIKELESKDIFDEVLDLYKKQASIKLVMSMMDEGGSKSKKNVGIDLDELMKMMLLREFVSGKKESTDVANILLMNLLREREKKEGIDPNTLVILDKLTSKQSYDPVTLLLLASKGKESNLEETLKWIEKIEAMRAKVDEEREKRRLEELKRLEDNFRFQFEKIAEQVAAGRMTPKDAAKEILDYIKVGKELATEIKTESSGSRDLAADLIKSTIEAIKEPVLRPMGEALATRVAQPQPRIIAVPKEAIEKKPEVKEIPEESPDYSNLIQVSSE